MNYVDSWLDTFERTARVGAVVDDAASKKSKGKSNSVSNNNAFANHSHLRYISHVF